MKRWGMKRNVTIHTTAVSQDSPRTITTLKGGNRKTPKKKTIKRAFLWERKSKTLVGKPKPVPLMGLEPKHTVP